MEGKKENEALWLQSKNYISAYEYLSTAERRDATRPNPKCGPRDFSLCYVCVCAGLLFSIVWLLVIRAVKNGPLKLM
jgi:hypothetical protein